MLVAPVVKAEGTDVVAAPQASSVGSVTNMAVQNLPGWFAKQSVGNGIHCSGPSFNPSIFYMGNQNSPNYTLSESFGITLGFNVPLDGGLTEICKSVARQRLQQDLLNFQLTRLHRCLEAHQKGFSFHPSSPFYVVCHDVVPFVNVPTSQAASDSAQATSAVSESKPESQVSKRETTTTTKAPQTMPQPLTQ